MKVKVLIVDDSRFFRSRIQEILEKDSDIEVVDTAENGKIGVEKAASVKPDVIIMDVEMPIMNGIDATREIMKKSPCPILMFSSLTHDGAQSTLDALDAGAADFMPKKFEDIADNPDKVAQVLQGRVKVLSKNRKDTSDILDRKSAAAPVTTSKPATTSAAPRTSSGKRYKLLVIGTSTGGPAALQEVLTKFPSDFPHPILLIQHMPAAFTPAFATRLDSLCKIKVKHADNGDQLENGCAYLAPGGMQMDLEKSGTTFKLKIYEGDSSLIYHPSVDKTFSSVARTAGGDVLSVVLTGMGADGREGAKDLKAKGATVWAQDEASCVVYGMPQAVTVAGISTHSISLDDMGPSIVKEIMNK